MKTVATLTALLLSLSGWAQTGNEWQNPETLSQGKEEPRAYMFSFADMEEAKHVLPYASSYYQSLDGTWKFHWVASPEQRPADFYRTDYDVTAWDDIAVPGCWNVQGLQKDGTMKYGVPIYVNQPVIFYHEVRPGDWKEGVMRRPKDERWTTYKYPNEVGSYRRTFTVPADWKGRHVYINFDGVDSFFYLWINGHYVGFNKNSRNTASFDITPYLARKGENVLAVEVYRSSDGSFLEAQDMFRLPGIFRSTYLTSMPDVQMRDLAVRTARIDGAKAVVSVDAEVRDLGKKPGAHSIDYHVYEVDLYGDAAGNLIGKYEGKADRDSLTLVGVRPWSAEAPYRYALVATVRNAKGKVTDITSTYFGVRTVEIRDTKAEEDEFGLKGRYFYVNGKPVKLKGVNRHETNPSAGHAITHGQMEREVMLMKRGNINHVRLSHYSNDPYWYYLCDKYGLYLEDEANIESHEYYYGDASLSHPAEWKAAHVARNLEMVHSHVNHPSIVIWSLGNEAGPGENFVAAYEAIKAYDKSRPVQYERNNDIVDMGSNQYPSVSWVQQVAKGTAGVKYPYHISEYAHSMGNSLGNLVDYWEAMESTNFFCGAAIWDWVDQAIDTYTPDGTKYMGYGGDHGDWPNDGMFCMNGIMLPDLSPKPQYYEVKKVYQNVGVKEVDDKSYTGEVFNRPYIVEVFNKNYFEALDYDVVYKVRHEGRLVKEGKLQGLQGLEPRKARQIEVPFNFFEYYDKWDNMTVEIEFLLPRDMPWAKKGYVQMAEQFEHRWGAMETPYKVIARVAAGGGTLAVDEGKPATSITGKDFSVTFDNADGSIRSYTAGGRTLIEDGNGPRLDAFRAPVDNDNWAWNQWFQNGLYDLRHKVQGTPLLIREDDGSVSLVYTVRSQATHHGQAIHRPGKAGEPFQEIRQGKEMAEDEFHFTTTQRYTVYPDGSINLLSSIVSSDAGLALPRLGYAMKLPRTLDRYTYYGRGPLNNYSDRKTGSFIGLYESTVAGQFVAFPKPQSMGNREDVAWCALTDKDGNGLAFVADYERRMSTSALPWSALQMTLAAHPHELPESDGTYLHLDCKVNGLGGNSCGQGGPLEPDRVKGALHQMGFVIRPVSKDNLAERVRVTTSYLCPVSIVRDRAGHLSILGDMDDPTGQPILYTILPTGGKKASAPRYVKDGEELNLREGGTVTAWYEVEPEVKTTATFGRIETVPVEVAYVSSEEGPGGEVAKNLVDGNPATIWHTMYSITVPKYPHWVDFDCGETKTIKGFTYLPRQDGPNGNIKGYKVQLSMDGKAWGDTVCEGEFENNAKEKKVTFARPQKARYLRFTALSSQNGQDFASGAEFTVIAE